MAGMLSAEDFAAGAAVGEGVPCSTADRLRSENGGVSVAAAAGAPATSVVASTVVRLGRAPAQRFTPMTLGKPPAIWRLSFSSLTRFQSGCGDGGNSGAMRTVSP